MELTKRVKVLIGTAAFVGAASIALSGLAVTGTGVTNNAGSTQFVGGTVSQGVTGAALSSIAYTFGDAPANTAIHSALLTFGVDADGRTVAMQFTGGNAVVFTCTAVEVTNHTSTCTTAGADRTGATSASITVS
jgi:hypothetical protein